MNMSIEDKISELTAAVKELTAVISQASIPDRENSAPPPKVDKPKKDKPAEEEKPVVNGKPAEEPEVGTPPPAAPDTIEDLLANGKTTEAFDVLRIKFLALCALDGKDQAAIALMQSYKPTKGKLSGVAQDKWQELYDKFVALENE
jgi:hypothetical protein